jgi:hypothetical protein
VTFPHTGPCDGVPSQAVSSKRSFAAVGSVQVEAEARGATSAGNAEGLAALADHLLRLAADEAP